MTVLLKKHAEFLTNGSAKDGYFDVLKEDGFDSVILKLRGGIAVSLLAWESCMHETEIRMTPELLDAIATNWMEYRRGQAKEVPKTKSKRNRKKLLPDGVFSKT